MTIQKEPVGPKVHLGKLKLLFIIPLILSALLFSACGQQGTDKSTPPKTDQTTEQKTEPKTDTYPDHEITFIVPYNAGGGYDLLARLAAPVLSKNLPNNPPVVVKNVSGGGGLIGVTTNYKSAPDGYTIGVMSGGAVMPQLAGKAEYDLRQFSWIGLMSLGPYMTAASLKSNIKSLEDLKKKSEVLVGTSGFTAMDGVAGLTSADKMGYKAKYIAHNGSQEAVLALIRGDVDIIHYPANVLLELCKTGEVTPLWTYTEKRMPELPNVPTLAELGYPELGKLIQLSRPLAAPPGVPQERLDMLRKAFEAALKDPSYQDMVINKNKETIVEATPAEVRQLIESQFTSFAPFKDLISQ